LSSVFFRAGRAAVQKLPDDAKNAYRYRCRARTATLPADNMEGAPQRSPGRADNTMLCENLLKRAIATV
jgi:hypothetical protein